MPVSTLSDSDEASDFTLVPGHAEHSMSRRKRIGGVVAATTVLLLGAAAVYHNRGAQQDEAELERSVQYEEMVVVPPRGQCTTKAGENCMSTRCCGTSGFKCYMKDGGYAKCMSKCTPGKDGWCTELVNTKPVHAYPGVSLFCFAFYTNFTGTTKKSYELDLLRTQLFLGASLFGCPKWIVYSDVNIWLSPGPPALNTTKLDDVDGNFHQFKRKKAGTWVNAMIFYQAWMHMRTHKLTEGSDWVVKVDADAVFLPARLIGKLSGYKVPDGGVYFENCKHVMYGFFGNLEVASKSGFDLFLTNLESCKKTLDWKGEDPDWKYGPWGEDLFMQKCMDKVGVAKMTEYDISADGACKANRPKPLRKVKGLKWHPNCQYSQDAISMHPFKKPSEYFKCLADTQWTWTWPNKPWEHKK